MSDLIVCRLNKLLHKPRLATPLDRYKSLSHRLAGVWGFLEGAGEVVVDSYANNNGVFVNTPTWAGGKAGHAIDFVKANTDRINCGYSGIFPDGANPITIIARVKSDLDTGDLANNEGMHICARDHNANGRVFTLGMYDRSGSFVFDFYVNGGGDVNPPGNELRFGSPVKNAWYDVGITFAGGNGDTIYGYVDGEFVSSIVTDEAMPSGTANFTIGGREYAGYEQSFDGKIEFVYLWNRTFTAQEFRLFYRECCRIYQQDEIVVVSAESSSVTLQEPVHGQIASISNLTRSRTALVRNAIHGHLAEVSQLSKAMTLIVQDTVHGHLSDAVLATRDRSLTTQGAIHDQLASVSALARDRTLAAQSTIHDHLADVSTVTRGGVISLTLQDTIHGHLSHVADVDRDRGLHVQDTVHGQLATVASLSKGLVLELQDAVHGHICDAVAPSRERTVNLQEPVHGQFADSVTLLLIKQLTTQDSIHGQLADVPLLSAVIGLTVQSSIHSSLSSVPSVNIASTLTIQNSIHGQFVSRPSLSVGVRYPQRIWQAAYSTFNFVAKDSTYTSTASNMNYINIAKEDK